MSGEDTTQPWPTLQDFVEYDDQLSIGRIGPIACAAVVSDEAQMYVALVRRDSESLTERLTRSTWHQPTHSTTKSTSTK